MKPSGFVRWDPSSRAGAIAVKPRGRHDMRAMGDVTDAVMDWASYEDLGANVDNAETSTIRGTYDWRAYLKEEAELARKRDAKPAKKPEAPAPAPAPNQLYA